MQKLLTQAEWISRAREVLPAGGFGNFDPEIILSHGQGAHVWDQDGREYIDYLIGSGPMLLGHGHPEVMEAVLEQLPKGMTFFANNTKGIELSEEIVQAVPCAEQVRFVASGGEADMYAIRLARAFTGRNKILKFEGGYHGNHDYSAFGAFATEPVNYPVAGVDTAIAQVAAETGRTWERAPCSPRGRAPRRRRQRDRHRPRRAGGWRGGCP